MRVSVIGTGYLGAVQAAGMAELGFETVGIDVDEAKVALLSEGKAPFFEPGLEPLLGKHIGEGGRLRFTTDFAAAADAEVHFLCIGTPQAPGSDAADLTYVESAVRSEEHTSELQSLMRISYAVFCLKKKKTEIMIYASEKYIIMKQLHNLSYYIKIENELNQAYCNGYYFDITYVAM